MGKRKGNKHVFKDEGSVEPPPKYNRRTMALVAAVRLLRNLD